MSEVQQSAAAAKGEGAAEVTTGPEPTAEEQSVGAATTATAADAASTKAIATAAAAGAEGATAAQADGNCGAIAETPAGSKVLEVDQENKVVYRTMTPADAKAVANAVAVAFANGEPITAATGSTDRDMHNFVAMYVPRMAAEGYTVMAEDAETRAVLGAFLNEDFCNPDPPEIEEFLETCEGSWGPVVMTMIEQLEEELIKIHGIAPVAKDRTPGEYFHLWMIGVAPEGRGRGLGRKLFHHSVALARARGFKLAFAECTGALSTHLFKKYLNAKLEAYVDYAKWDGALREAVNSVPAAGHPGMSMLSVELQGDVAPART